MSTTKIINVLKDDKFEEILDIFKNSTAQEVIFVLPKSSKLFKKESDFSILRKEADKLGKDVSLLCPNSDINSMATKYGFDVLLARDNDNTLIKTVNQIEPEKTAKKTEDSLWEDKELPGVPIEANKKSESAIKTEPESKTLAQTIATRQKIKKDPQIINTNTIKVNMNDIIRPDGEEKKNLKIIQKKEKPAEVEVRKEISTNIPEDQSENLKSIWNFGKDQGAESSRKGIWDDKIPKKAREEDKKNIFYFFRVKNRDSTLAGKIIAGTLALSIIVLGSIIYVSVGHAKITIYPKKQYNDFKLKIDVSDKFSSVDLAFNRIPGQMFPVEKVLSETFRATGEKDAVQKARGKITISNEYSTSPQALIASTRFEGPNGLIFRTLKNVTVPGMIIKGSEIQAGKAFVEVVADKAGPEYNISPSAFRIIAFKEKGDMEKYNKITGSSSEPMRGGINGKATIVSELDYKTATDSIKEKTINEINNTLNSQAHDFKILETPQNIEITMISTNQPDDAVENFTVTASGSIRTLGFKESDLFELIKQYIEKGGKITAIPGKIELTYNSVKFNEITGLLSFEVSVKGNFYAIVDKDAIISDLMGKNKKEIESYFKAKNDIIETSRVKLSPAWVTRIPKNKDDIDCFIEY